MSLVTNWGYTITDADELNPLLSAEDFAVLTAQKYAGDARTEPNIAAASQGVREFCGWHVYPQQTCRYRERLLSGNGRVKRAGTDILIQLPAAYVTEVSRVQIDGEESEDFDFSTNGLLRIFDVYQHQVTRKTEITVTYTAGLPKALMSGVEELIAHQAAHALASTNGVQSEAAGGVSITYSASWINLASPTALTETAKETLAPYKMREVF